VNSSFKQRVSNRQLVVKNTPYELECEWVKTVWFATPLGINFSSNDEANLNFNEWISKVVINEDREVVQLVVAICYEIWRIRNKRCFEGIDMPYALSVCNSACKAIRILT
jgi:hypothetical protein